MKTKSPLNILNPCGALIYIFVTLLSCPSVVLTAQESLLSTMKYRDVGPSRGGRSTTVAGVAAERATFYMGTTGGGVWKTTNYGNTWENVSDGYFASPSIGAIDVSENNPDLVYVGTGTDGIRSNVIPGKGVYKSTDGGKSWAHVGLEKTKQIGAVLIHPNNDNIVYVAAIGNAFGDNEERGLYMTSNGGNSWQKVLHVSNRIGIADIEFAPDDPNTIYATAWHVRRKPYTIISGGEKMGGIYKSTDGGKNWNKLTNGLPGGLIGKSDLAVSAANPNRVWAIVEAPERVGEEGEGEGGVYRSDDRGNSWKLVSTHRPLLDRPFYYCNIDVNPQNPDHLFVSATGFWVSKDGGKSWKRNSVPHGDNHGIWMNPTDENLYVQCNDGGANVTLDGGKTWSSQLMQPTSELYQVAVDDQYPYWIYAGQQDNSSTLAVPSLPPYPTASDYSSYWMRTGGCETGPAIPKPGNHNIVYANCKGRFGVFNKLTGEEKQYYVGASNIYGHNPKDLKFRFQRVSPIYVSPHNPDVVYHASQYLHKTIDDGKTWEIISPDLTAFTPETQVISGSPITRDVTGEEFYSTIYSVNESPIKEGLIWVGANDGPVHVTKDGGKNWDKVTPSTIPSGGRVNGVEPSPHRENKAYVVTYRYLLDDFKPYIYKTEDYGKSWELLTTGTNGIPADCPTRVIREDTEKEGLLYAGTDQGVFISFNDGKTWEKFQQNLPVTPITDIKVYRGDLVLSTMGRGFWILDDITPLRAVQTSQLPSEVTFFEPRNTHRLRYRATSPKTTPYYPVNGVRLTYALPNDISDVTITITNSENKVVRVFSSEEQEPITFQKLSDRPTPIEKKLSSTKGVHRFMWDLRHYGSINKDGRVARGPMVLPGTYTITMKASGSSISRTVEVLQNPNGIKTGTTQQDLAQQEQLSLQIRDLQTEINAFVALLNSAKARSKFTKKQSQVVSAIEGRIYTKPGRYMQPMLIDQLRYLNSMLDRADQAPGKDAFNRYKELKSEFDTIKSNQSMID